MIDDERAAEESSVAIDLSRRKSIPPPPSRWPSNADLLRDSIRGARRVAAPYATMARIALAQLVRDRRALFGVFALATFALVGVFADVLASDLPLACRWRGTVYLMPNVTNPPALSGLDCARMARERQGGDWLVSPLVAHGPAHAGDAAQVLLAPLTPGHPFGTDALGRDVFARVVFGARTALGAGVAAAIVLVAVGVALGALAGFLGGVVDAVVSRAVESLTAVPTVVLVLVVGALVAHPTTLTLLCAVALTRWTELARLVRGEVLRALAADYVTAARALGASPARILWRHVLPNAIAPAVVGATLAVGWVVLVEATVDFLRVGSWNTTASWGEVMGEARAHAGAWWLVAFPGAALLSTLVSLNLLGEAARNALDPRLRGEQWVKASETPTRLV